MKINNFEDSKILYTNRIWKWIKTFKNEKDVLVITPLTKISELLNFKTASLLRTLVDEQVSDLTSKAINFDYLEKIRLNINDQFNAEVLTIDLNHDKLLKTLLVPNEKIELDEALLNKYLMLLDKVTTRQLQIVVSGFNIASDNSYTMLNVHILANHLKELVTWNNVEQLVLLDIEEGLEIIDGEKLKSWLELQTKTVLTRQDLNNYFSGSMSFQSFLISKALRNL